MRCVLAVAVLFCACNVHAYTVADSVAEFSGVQGQDNWYYGYIDAAVNTFHLIPNFVTDYPIPVGNVSVLSDAWVVSTNYSNPVPFTYLAATSGHPNSGTGRQATVRRWISEVSGQIDITGEFGDWEPSFGPPGGSDGVNLRVVIDGFEQFSRTTDGDDPESPYSLSALVNVGSTVDFVVDPRRQDASDHFFFSAVITVVPEPSTLLLLAACILRSACCRRGFRSLGH